MIAAVIRSALVDEAFHAGLRLRLEDMRERSARLELRADKKARPGAREIGVGITRFEQLDLAASTSPALVVVTEASCRSTIGALQPPLDRQRRGLESQR